MEQEAGLVFPSKSEARSGAAALAAFHRGERVALEACYSEHFDAVDRVVGAVLKGADHESVVHEVFYRLLSRQELRESFQGGSMHAWITTIARNLAIDHRRRSQRESLVAPDVASTLAAGGAAGQGSDRPEPGADVESELLVEAFRRELTPEQLPLFELRFMRELTQQEAARALGISRTTLAYREIQIRRRLRRFLLREGFR